MPLSPPDATLWIRATSTINRAALTSVGAQLDGQLAEVESWPNTPAKGRMRDTLSRMKAAYSALADRSQETIRLANVVLDMFGEGDAPDPPQPSIVWSTGAW
jgi:hypothetical protein